MTPAGVTLRITLFAESAMYRLPDASTATPLASPNSALVAGPPLPVNPHVPLPATVEMTPPAVILRTTQFPSSPIQVLPEASTTTSSGELIVASDAGPWSPE